MLKAFGLNCLKVQRFQSCVFKRHQPAPLQHARAAHLHARREAHPSQPKATRILLRGLRDGVCFFDYDSALSEKCFFCFFFVVALSSRWIDDHPHTVVFVDAITLLYAGLGFFFSVPFSECSTSFGIHVFIVLSMCV